MQNVLRSSLMHAVRPIKQKISPVQDWRSTPTYCQLQGHVTQK